MWVRQGGRGDLEVGEGGIQLLERRLALAARPAVLAVELEQDRLRRGEDRVAEVGVGHDLQAARVGGGSIEAAGAALLLRHDHAAEQTARGGCTPAGRSSPEGGREVGWRCGCGDRLGRAAPLREPCEVGQAGRDHERRTRPGSAASAMRRGLHDVGRRREGLDDRREEEEGARHCLAVGACVAGRA